MKKIRSNMLLGAHVSTAQKLHLSFSRAEKIGCTAMQIFTRSSRQWHGKELSLQEIDDFKEAKKKSSIAYVAAHASYLINVGSSTQETAQRSILGLKDELERCHKLEIPHLVLHPGSAGATSIKECLRTIAQNLDHVLKISDSTTMILLETSAGQGTSVGYTFDQLSEIVQSMNLRNRIGFCFDTCHAFAAGYNFSTQDLYNKMWLEWDTIIGIEHLKLIHMNDSKKELASRVDRHEHIGQGNIGLQPFSFIMNDKRFTTTAKIIETPKLSELDDERNINILLDLYDAKN